MTEEIIIDCIHKHYDSEICNAYSNNVFSWNCSEFNNCYYKQLKRLEQENKALQAYKDINEDFKQAWYELNEKYKQLRSALEEIRKAIKSYDLTVDNGASVDTLYKIRKIINEVLTP